MQFVLYLIHIGLYKKDEWMEVMNNDIVTVLKGSDALSRGKAEETRPRP